MSMDFWTKPRLRIEKLFDGRLEAWGIFEPRGKDLCANDRCLADGENHVRVFQCGSEDLVITSYALYDPYRILKAISEAFDVEIWFERDLQTSDHVRVIKRPTRRHHQAGASARVKGADFMA